MLFQAKLTEFNYVAIQGFDVAKAKANKNKAIEIDKSRTVLLLPLADGCKNNLFEIDVPIDAMLLLNKYSMEFKRYNQKKSFDLTKEGQEELSHEAQYIYRFKDWVKKHYHIEP